MVLLAGTGTDTIKEQIPGVQVVDSVEAAVTAGLGVAAPGDILLFSPGFASFGMFKNEYERNDAFLAAVNSMLHE